jgi:single-strand DNA-binding protein
MMMKNWVQLIGNLGADPELFQFESGKRKVQFNLATNEWYRNQDQELVEETNWHRIIAWDSIADQVADSLKKGEKVIVQGKLTSRSYEDKDGVKRSVTEVSLRAFDKLIKEKIVDPIES